MPRALESERQRGATVDRVLGILLVLQVVGLIYAGLSPFAFAPENRVGVSVDGHGLTFDTVGIATSEGSIRSARYFPDGALTIHLMIRPDAESPAGLGTILAVDDDTQESPLIIAQWKSSLIMRVRDAESASRGYWEMDAAGFPAGESHLLTISSGAEHGTAMYVDGIATGGSRTRSIIGDRRPLNGKLLLGCLANGSAGWRGKLLGLAIVGSVLDPLEVAADHARIVKGSFSALANVRDLVALYDFSKIDLGFERLLYTADNRVVGSPLGGLEVPRTFAPMHPEIFGVPPLRDMKADWFLKDLLRNIAGFVPLGFVTGLILIRNQRKAGYVIAFQAAVVGLLLSAAIESIQIALPMRSSSLSDLSLNGIGAVIGAVVALAFRHSRLGHPNP